MHPLKTYCATGIIQTWRVMDYHPIHFNGCCYARKLGAGGRKICAEKSLFHGASWCTKNKESVA